VLLFGHGGAHSKDSERFVRLCRAYAERTGLAVVCIDAVDHGERRSEGASPGLPARWHSNAVPQMVTDWQTTAEALACIGPTVAYVGFSLGSVFGAPTVATIPSINAAVFGVGGIPTGMGIDDAPLRPLLFHAASQLDRPQILMINMTQDEIFRRDDTHAFFDAIPGRRKRLVFWEGGHEDWPVEAIEVSIDFLNESA
jgi:pimeloyl-ACP methyl ester carboxylesterase